MLIIEIIFLVVFWAWVITALFFVRNTILPRIPLTSSPSDFQLAFETVRFQTSDGILLEGWKIPSGSPIHPWIILCHGLGSNRSDLLEIAKGLNQSGFSLLLFDFRAHGTSAGRVTSFGLREQRDLEAALTYLGQQPDVPVKPYGIYGISMGGAVAILVAAKDERLGSLVADSSYPDLEGAIIQHMKLRYRIPKLPFSPFVSATYRACFGAWPKAVSPTRSLSAFAPRPILMIHGDSDERVPPKAAQKSFSKASEPKELWLLKGTGHLGAYAMDPAQYIQRLSSFFKANLGHS